MDDFVAQWLEKPERNPDNLSENTIRSDRWDRKYFDQMLSSIPDFMIGHEHIEDHVETGSPMWADLFWMLWKVEPTQLAAGDIKPTHLINRMVGEEMMEIPDYIKLKYFSESNDVACAIACVDLRETLERLFDRAKALEEKLEEVMDLLRKLASLLGGTGAGGRDIDKMIKAWSEGYNPDDPESKEQAKQEAIENIKQKLEEMAPSVAEEVDALRPVIASSLREALKDAADEAQALSSQGDLWGDEAGQLQRLPANERMNLARKLLDTRFRLLLQLIGPLRRVMEDAQRRRTITAQDEVYRITLGNDIPRVLPMELVKMHHPSGRLDFRRKYLERQLPQYDLRGKEKIGKGKLILCLDNSGSMMGQKEMFGKAVAGCALHLARKQKRGFFGIHFGSRHEIKTFDFPVDKNPSPQDVIDYMEFFFNGGTDFERPLTVALEVLQEEFDATGKVSGDIMFVTDGICGVRPDWLKDFKAEQERLQFKVYGFLIGGYGGKDSEPLHTIADGRVIEVEDLFNPNVTSTTWESI